MMEISLNAAILLLPPPPPPPPLPRISKFNFPPQQKKQPLRFSAISCLGKHGEVNGLTRASSEMELEGGGDNAEVSQSSNWGREAKPNEIWRLFREAQQNILYLNKQRLKALDELNKSNREKKLLLDRIEQLEVDKRGKDKSSLCWELLLRIDSMVLSGMVSTGEASELRGLVMNCKYSVADIFSDIRLQGDAELLAELRHFSQSSKMNGLHIMHICTEMAPLVSVGSLASYVTGLSYALQKKGHLVEVILPKYVNLDLGAVQGLREIETESYSFFNGQLHGNKIWTGVIHGIGVTFIEPLVYSSFFSRERVYGYTDDFERFTYFSRASLDYIIKSGKKPDVLHIHNWHTAIIGPLFWDIFVDQGLGGTRILLTCHGFDSQCLVQPDKLALCGLDPDRLNRPDRLQDNNKTNVINILKGGIVYSNKVVILSSINSKGKIIRSFNHGLESTLAIHKDKLVISPCGFDSSTWDPFKDKFLPENYSAQDMRGKAVCKVALQQQLGLSKQASRILVGCIVSEVSDVDLKNLKAVFRNTTKTDVQFIFMGSKMPSVNRTLESLQVELEDESIRFIKTYDEALSHLVFAGSDIIMCLSFHDPLLQVPLKALKYGAAPIPVTPNIDGFGHFTDDNETTKFSQFISSAFGNMSLSQALDEIKNDPSKWSRKMRDAMTRDFSWNAECYDVHVSAYTAIIKNL